MYGWVTGERLVNGATRQGSEGAAEDEGCNRMMEDRAKWMEGKKGQPSHTSSSREKRQINSRRIESPIIIGPQHSFTVCDETQK
jgi:hypothetical protein